jgi:heterodisulfide reductase subunit B
MPVPKIKTRSITSEIQDPLKKLNLEREYEKTMVQAQEMINHDNKYNPSLQFSKHFP